MTIDECLQIKRMLEGNFLRVKEMDDTIFASILGEYDFRMMVEASREIIKTSKFPPTIANLIEKYEDVKLHHKTEIVRQMQKAGCFYDMSEFQKALYLVERDIIPAWFREMMINFINQPKLVNDKQLLLEVIR